MPLSRQQYDGASVARMSSPSTLVCSAHGLRYDPALASGCVLCRRTSAPPSKQRGLPRWALLTAILLALSSVAFVLHRSSTNAIGHDDPNVARPIRAANAAGRTGAYYVPHHEAARPLPVLVFLHGTGGDGASAVRGLRALADEYGFMVIAPDSGSAPDGQWSWEVGSHPGEITGDYRHVMECLHEAIGSAGVQVDAEHVL